MVRLRHVSMIITLSLVAWAATASIECAWNVPADEFGLP